MGVNELGRSGEVVYVVLAKQVGDTPHHPCDDSAAALDGLGVVHVEVVEGDAEVRCALDEADNLGVAKNGFAGNTAPVEAYTAHLFSLHQRGFESKLTGPNGGDIAARPGANYGDIVLCGGGSQPGKFLLERFLGRRSK